MFNALDNLFTDEVDWQNLIEENFRKITEVLRPDDVANWLRQEKILNRSKFEDVTNPHSNNKKRAETLLDIVKTRSTNGIKKFLTVISYEYPELFVKITGLEPLDVPDDYTPERLSTYATNVYKRSLKTAMNKYQMAHVELNQAINNELLQGGNSRLSDLKYKIDELQKEKDYFKEEYGKTKAESDELKVENSNLKAENHRLKQSLEGFQTNVNNSNDNSHPSVYLRHNNNAPLSPSSPSPDRMGYIFLNENVNFTNNSDKLVAELSSKLKDKDKDLRDKSNAAEYWEEQTQYYKERFEKLVKIFKDSP